LGGGKKDKGCEEREVARLMAEMGATDVAYAILCASEAVERTIGKDACLETDSVLQAIGGAYMEAPKLEPVLMAQVSEDRAAQIAEEAVERREHAHQVNQLIQRIEMQDQQQQQQQQQIQQQEEYFDYRAVKRAEAREVLK